jgi:N-acetylmuramoyl-L-alanine amidase
MINKIVIHVSDSPDTMDIGAKEIRKWHTDPKPKGNGWSDIGYHYVVRRNGHIELGRLHTVTGAHVAGHNTGSLGICWVGRDKITTEQMDTLVKLAKNLIAAYNLTVKDVVGHKELNAGKSCPNLDMNQFRSKL